MHILCWNIQVNSGKTVTDAVALLMKHELKPFTAGSFALFILENKTQPDEVGNRIKDAIGNNAQMHVVAAGGNAHRRENVICVYSQDVRLIRSQQYTTWQAGFEAGMEDDNERVTYTLAQQGATARNRYALRSPAHTVTMKEVKPDAPRNPVLFVLGTTRGELKVVVVHSPGPSARTELMSTPEAQLYFGAVMSMLRNEDVHIVVGDFNLYRIDTPPAGFTEQSSGPSPTTYGTGKLDRVFVKDISKCHAYVFGSANRPAYTDHRGIGLSVGDPRKILTSSLADMRCSVCATAHGWQISIMNHWHQCQRCGQLYCGACGAKRSRLAGCRWLERVRVCGCGGETRLLS